MWLFGSPQKFRENDHGERENVEWKPRHEEDSGDGDQHHVGSSPLLNVFGVLTLDGQRKRELLHYLTENFKKPTVRSAVGKQLFFLFVI